MGGSGRKCWSLVRKAMWEAFELLARLHSWVAGQDTVRTARRMPNAKTDTLFFLSVVPFLLFPMSVALSLSISKLSLYFHSLYSSMSPCSFHAAFLMNPLLHIQFFIWAYFLCLCLSFCFPLPLCNSWHSILSAEYFAEGGGMYVCMCVCVHLHVWECIYSCQHLCVCLCIG